MNVPRANLQLSEILQAMVDQGELTEGSPDYLLSQRVVREGFTALGADEQAAFRERVEPLLEARHSQAQDSGPEPRSFVAEPSGAADPTTAPATESPSEDDYAQENRRD